MSARRIIYLTHAEVEVDPGKPPAEWPLSEIGRSRHKGFASSRTLENVSAVYSSTELKARQGAECVAQIKGLKVKLCSDLNECDRSSTGYLPNSEFGAAIAAFFDRPDQSIDGWESAASAQHRIVKAVRKTIMLSPPVGDVLVVAHGTVGALLRSYLLGCSVSKSELQPSEKTSYGGSFFTFDTSVRSSPTDWVRI